jgi:hypothetical protein
MSSTEHSTSTEFASIDQFEAAETGNLAWFQHHKAAGTLPDLMLADMDGYYLHELAADKGHLPVVRYLIEDSGQSVDATINDNFALRYAACNGHLPVVRYLIEESGQPVNITAWDNGALKFATLSDRTDVIQYLETVIPIVEAVGIGVFQSLGLELAREALQDRLSTTSKNASPKRRI